MLNKSNKQLGLSDWIPRPDKQVNTVTNDSWFHVDSCSGPGIENNRGDRIVKVIDYQSIYNNADITTNYTESIVTKMILVVPNRNQSCVLRNWFYQSLLIHNLTVDYVRYDIYQRYKFNKKGMTKLNPKNINVPSFNTIQQNISEYINKIQNMNTRYKISIRVITSIMNSAITYCTKVLDKYKTSIKSWHQSNYRNNLRYPKLCFRFMTNSSRRLSISVIPSMFLNKDYYGGFFQSMKFSHDISKLNSVVKFQYDSVKGKFYLVLVEKTMVQTKTLNLKKNVCGVDPGAREFFVVYSKNNEVHDICTGKDFDRIEKLHQKIKTIKKLMNYSSKDRSRNLPIKTRSSKIKSNKKKRKKKHQENNLIYQKNTIKKPTKKDPVKILNPDPNEAPITVGKLLDKYADKYARVKDQLEDIYTDFRKDPGSKIENLLDKFPNLKFDIDFLPTDNPLHLVFAIDSTTKNILIRQLYYLCKKSGSIAYIKSILRKIGITIEFIKSINPPKITSNPYYDYLVDLIKKYNTGHHITRNDQMKIVASDFKEQLDINKPAIPKGYNKIILPTPKLKSVTKSIQSLRRALIKYKTRIYNMVKDLHYKVALWLVKNFSVIFMGKFSTEKMLACKTNKGRTYRIYSTLNHDMFFQRLQNMAQKYSSKVIFTDEFRTTQTCSNCNYIHKNIGSSKTFDCPSCGIVAERDANAAKNILKRGIIEYHDRKLKKTNTNKH